MSVVQWCRVLFCSSYDVSVQLNQLQYCVKSTVRGKKQPRGGKQKKIALLRCSNPVCVWGGGGGGGGAAGLVMVMVTHLIIVYISSQLVVLGGGVDCCRGVWSS